MKSILILNNDSTLLSFFDGMLSDRGYEVRTATNDEEALAILRSQSVDLLIQDIERPTGGGAEFLQLLKSDDSLRHMPVFITSGHNRAWGALILQERGLDIDRDLAGYFEMPFGTDRLPDAIKALLPP
jgi:CheY-like chemotaxis protein